MFTALMCLFSFHLFIHIKGAEREGERETLNLLLNYLTLFCHKVLYDVPTFILKLNFENFT